MRRVFMLLGILSAAGFAQEDVSCDRTAIRWHLPADFEAARVRAAAQNRLLIIKGISFGVDDEGARCATAGSW